MRLRSGGWMAIAMAMVMAAGCSGGSPPASGGTVQINGMGATFPYPIYSKWFAEYNRLHPHVQINYQSQGSGAGIRGLLAGTVFFGASDQPMKEEQMAAAPGKVLHFPTVLGAVVPVYNLAGVNDLKFTGPVLADIILGKVTKWNDPALARTQCRRGAAGVGHHRGAPLGRLRHDVRVG